jgi:hypothetical protein
MRYGQVEGFRIFFSALSIVTLLLYDLPVLFVLYFVLGFEFFLVLMGHVFEVVSVGRYISMPDNLSILGLLFVCIKSVMSCVLLFS